MSNVSYRILCVLGLAAMIIRGGDRRLLGIAAAGTYVIYVVLTCLFYFVGLAYENVSEVTLFVTVHGRARCRARHGAPVDIKAGRVCLTPTSRRP